MPLRRGVPPIVIASDTQQVTCEICGKVTLPANTFSIFVEYPMPGPGNVTQRCPCVQHFACSHAHAVLAAIVCMIFHLQDDTTHDNTAPTSPVAEQNLVTQARNALDRFKGITGQ